MSPDPSTAHFSSVKGIFSGLVKCILTANDFPIKNEHEYFIYHYQCVTYFN